jgi:predicted aminopeptidase
MRDLKTARLEQLSADVRKELRAAGQNENHWLTRDLNNARLLPMSLYDGQVPAFLALYADCGSDLQCLYEQAGKIAMLEPAARQARLDALAVRQEDLRGD